MRVTVAGALAAKPWNGGEAWVRLSYVLGLRRLGLQVAFVEQLAAMPPPDVLNWFRAVTERFSVDATLVDDDGTVLHGREPGEADVLRSHGCAHPRAAARNTGKGSGPAPRPG